MKCYAITTLTNLPLQSVALCILVYHLSINAIMILLVSVISKCRKYLVLEYLKLKRVRLNLVRRAFLRHKLTTVMFSWSPSKFCISLKHAWNPLALTFSTQTVAASCFCPNTVCSAVKKTYGVFANKFWKSRIEDRMLVEYLIGTRLSLFYRGFSIVNIWPIRALSWLECGRVRLLHHTNHVISAVEKC